MAQKIAKPGPDVVTILATASAQPVCTVFVAVALHNCAAWRRINSSHRSLHLEFDRESVLVDYSCFASASQLATGSSQ